MVAKLEALVGFEPAHADARWRPSLGTSVWSPGQQKRTTLSVGSWRHWRANSLKGGGLGMALGPERDFPINREKERHTFH